jgi:DNA polymerase zeta
VVRIFGTTDTPARQKVCANIHLAYPYFYVPFPMDSSNPLRPERVIGLCQRFAVSLNHAICLALRQNPTGGGNAANLAGGTDPKHLHVVSVFLVKGIPFYGYHIGYSYFLKVSLANPARMRIATEQLRKPVVLGREWQPHEAHLSHVLQFMCDFDLCGCGTLDLSGGIFRDPLPDSASSADTADSDDPTVTSAITTMSCPEEMQYPSGLSPPRDTYTELELDILPHQILNRNRLSERPLHHDFVELLHTPLNPEEKLVPAMRELWEDERRRRSAKGLGTGEGDMLPVSGGGRGRSMVELGYKVEGEDGEGGDGETKNKNRGGDWKISDELWAILEERMQSERARRARLSFTRFVGDVRSGKNGEKQKFDRVSFGSALCAKLTGSGS